MSCRRCKWIETIDEPPYVRCRASQCVHIQKLRMEKAEKKTVSGE
jgi:hypothetical protein